MDSDMHILEPADLWQRHIDPAYRDRAPVGMTRAVLDVGSVVEGKALGRGFEARQGTAAAVRLGQRFGQIHQEKYADAIARRFDNVSQLGAMEKEGIDVAVLFPTRGLFVLCTALDFLDTKLMVFTRPPLGKPGASGAPAVA
jgi:hypothetical protein